MENIILFDTKVSRQNLLPFTYTRPLADIRVGIFKLFEKWNKYIESEISFCTESYLEKKYPQKNTSNNLYIAGGVCPNKTLLQELIGLELERKLIKDGILIAFRTSQHISFEKIDSFSASLTSSYEIKTNFNCINFTWDIFRLNGQEIKSDFNFFTTKVSSKVTDTATIVYSQENIFIEKGAKIKAAILNAENGPIYIGKDTEIQEGAIIRGPFALCEGSTVNMGAKIKGDTTIGPHSKVGGEISNSVIFGCTNKGHDGFLGNSVIGEWCNIGADTNTSNLKNNYAEVRLWNYEKENFKKIGLQFCGLIMGDHSKCGINTMFNTGTVVGVNANIFGAGFPRNFIPSYSWGGANGFVTYTTKKAFEVARIVMKRRKVEFSDIDQSILETVFKHSSKFRI